eukprot:GHVQ01031406.1.p1 GENE.GHVQ01031406.1~~GHVQ01031406.1.p1  ORF type:complete len:224 (+),score=31.79 GHVQ01031406.1:951-1622(+)
MITEIPRYTTAKMEINTKVPHNPIMQDIKKGKPRYYHGPIFWHYGALPQTWEDPDSRIEVDKGEEAYGDDDPLDVVDITRSGTQLEEEERGRRIGDVVPVKVLGALCLIDGGELDWKVLAVHVNDPNLCDLNDVEDIDKVYPGTTSGIREWFRWYKTPDGKAVNHFGLQGELVPRSEAETIIQHNHASYWKLRKSSAGCANSHSDCIHRLWLPDSRESDPEDL